MKVDVKFLFYRTIMMFPIATLFSYYFDTLNKLLFSVLFLSLIYVGYRKIRKSNIVLVLLLITVYVYTIFRTGAIPYNFNELFYFPFMILYLNYLSEHIDELHHYLIKDYRYVRWIVNIWTILVLVSFAFPSSYTVEWGGARYFGSFCKSVWRLAPTCVFIMSLSIVEINLLKNKKAFFYLIVPFLAILSGGSRTYVVVALCLVLVAWYCLINSNIKFILTCIPFLLIVFLLLINSSIIDKFSATTYSDSSYFDLWGTITSGRSIFWIADIEAFINSSLLGKVLGQGFNSIYDINYRAFGGSVWAHNDFIQCLISHGLLGLTLYLVVMVKTFKLLKKYKVNWFILFLTIIIWLFNAMFNMFYTYFCSILSFPILILGLTAIRKKERLSYKIDNTFIIQHS